MLKHALTSALPPDPRPGVIQPADWNSEHVFSGGSAGQMLVRDTVDPNGAVWSSAPTLTSLQIVQAGATPSALAGSPLQVTVNQAALAAQNVIRFENINTDPAAGLRLDFMSGAGGTLTYGGFLIANGGVNAGVSAGSFSNHDFTIRSANGAVLRFNRTSVPAAGPYFMAFGEFQNTFPAFKRDTIVTDQPLTVPAVSFKLGDDTGYAGVVAGYGVFGTAPATIANQSILNVGNGNNPANNVMTVWGTASVLSFKDAANTVQHAYLIGGGNGNGAIGTTGGLRIGGGSGGGVLVLNENGGASVFGGPLHFGIYNSATRPALSWSGAELRSRLADDSAFADFRGADLIGNGNGTGTVKVGGINADRTYGGIWIGQASPDFTNYCFLMKTGTGQMLFNAPNNGGANVIDFRLANASRLQLGAAGLTINGTAATAPTIPFTVRNIANSSDLLTITDAGLVKMPGLGAFVGGDKYVTVDASGNLHKSALGPAS